MHGRSPTHEDRRDLFWLSRLAFQFRRASASLSNALPSSAVAATEGVVEEAKVAKWSREINKTTWLQNKTLNAMTLVTVGYYKIKLEMERDIACVFAASMG
ncbi:hypothetical protein CMV_019050 [Castanea mollissima]|uniref:Uncharacterized protein n=1 Tax=Castanea mollissima TaxID=60419 RepID=A0A8J4QNN0_9ROSI|nr:hypothetical protein CMV_019050 [Castanea mollissima]